MNSSLVTQFPFWAVVVSVAAYFFPAEFSSFKPAIVPLLSVVMFGMGMTLTADNFKAVLKKPVIIAIGVFIQFFLMPLIAWGLAMTFELSTELLVGMILVGSSAGGTASNVICYLARGNVALSILMTLTSTICAIVLMPAITFVYLNQSVPVPVLDMMTSILLIVILPVILGTAINTLFGRHLETVQPIFPVISCLAIIAIIAIIVGLNQNNLANLKLPVLWAVMLHNLIGPIVGYIIPKLMKYDPETCRTVAIEVAMQNSGLSVALAIKYFSTTAALPGALFSIWHNISGSILATYWRKKNPPRRKHYCH